MKRSIFNFRNSIIVISMMMASAASAAPVLWIDDDSGRLGKVDVETGDVSLVGSMGAIMTDIAFDPHGNLFGITFNSLYSINVETASTLFIGNLGATLNSLVFNSDGTLYGANNGLYTINPTTGAATLVGNGGTPYNSSGDLAFVGGNLYLSSLAPGSDNLLRLNTANGVATTVGSIGVSNVYGLATDDNVRLYGVADTKVYEINTETGVGTLKVDYSGQTLTAANGTAFISEAVAAPTLPVPEPETYAMIASGLGLVGMAVRRRKNAMAA